jgi:hypothetical protein
MQAQTIGLDDCCCCIHRTTVLLYIEAMYRSSTHDIHDTIVLESDMLEEIGYGMYH